MLTRTGYEWLRYAARAGRGHVSAETEIPLATSDEAAPVVADGSPFTGISRDDWERSADLMLSALTPYASGNGALYALPGRTSWDGQHHDALQGFARPFLLAAYRIRGAGGEGMSDLIDRYAGGLCAGVHERGSSGWPRHSESSQSIVEAALIALALYESRPWIWDRLDPGDQRAVAGWLSEVSDQRLPVNNWLLFPVVVNEFLRAVDQPHSTERIRENLDVVDSMYRGDGWYSDGFGQNFDHYCGWGLAFYTAMWSLMGGERHEPTRAEQYLERLGAFVDQYQYLFGSEGNPVHFGRSLSYRFAACAPLWLAARTGVSSLRPGVVRRIASGCLKYFLDRGAIDPDTGLLTVGWHGAWEAIAESYMAPASPYWAAKAFCGLAIVADDPVWSDIELPSPVEEGDFVVPLSAPGWLVQGTEADGVVRLHNHGSDHFPWDDGPLASPHYRKVAYSTVSAPELEQSSDADSQVVFRTSNGRRGFRRHFHRGHVSAQTASSTHYPFEVPDPPRLRVRRRRPWLRAVAQAPSWDVRIDLLSLAKLGVEVRVARCVTPTAGTLELGGYAVAGETEPEGECRDARASARTPDGLRSTEFGLLDSARATLERQTGTNAFGRHSAAPVLHFDVAPGETLVAVVVVLGLGDSAHENCPVTHCAPAGNAMVLTWEDMSRDEISFRRGSWTHTSHPR